MKKEKIIDTIGFIAIILIAATLTIMCGCLVFGEKEDVVIDYDDSFRKLNSNIFMVDEHVRSLEEKINEEKINENNGKAYYGTAIGNYHLLEKNTETPIRAEMVYGVPYDGSDTQEAAIFYTEELGYIMIIFN